MSGDRAVTPGPVDVVKRFCEAWSSGDPEQLLAFMTADAVFHNIPMEPIVGGDALRTAFEGYFRGASNFHFEILNTATAGGTVFAERLDHFDIGEVHVELPCNGVFEVVDGRIAAWRDYFDEGTITRQLSR